MQRPRYFERMRTKDSLRKANEELSTLVVELQKHDREMRLINHMNDLLQACKTQEEAYQVIALAVGELFAGKAEVWRFYTILANTLRRLRAGETRHYWNPSFHWKTAGQCGAGNSMRCRIRRSM